MSPVGGVGINLAIQDAVAAVTCSRPLRENAQTDDLAALQRRRDWPTRVTQRMQIAVQNEVLAPVLAGEAEADLLRPVAAARAATPAATADAEPDSGADRGFGRCGRSGCASPAAQRVTEARFKHTRLNLMNASSFGLGARSLTTLVHLRISLAWKLAEFLRRGEHRIEAERLEPRRHLGQGEDPLHFGVPLARHLFRRPGGGEHGEPGGRLESGRPCSATVGMSGAAAERLALVWASARSLPSLPSAAPTACCRTSAGSGRRQVGDGELPALVRHVRHLRRRSSS